MGTDADIKDEVAGPAATIESLSQIDAPQRVWGFNQIPSSVACIRPPHTATTSDLSETLYTASYTPVVTISSESTLIDLAPISHEELENTPTSSDLQRNMENRLQVRTGDHGSSRQKALEDARQMQASVIEALNKNGEDPPKYALMELIGKGSFGRVYKSKDMTSAAIVAVKIIDIDKSDLSNPRTADAFNDVIKEVNALKLMSESKARNVNHVIEALQVGTTMWMVTEYCGGGSISTLMKPTLPGGLQEKWIITIVREVAEGLRWVHQADIIHRDVKCANVLITEQGDVQLCDFGVASMMQSKVDKRSTVVGTPHWMAPELFGPKPIYGKEIDIWAFGCMVFEMATGQPPGAHYGPGFDAVSKYLKNNVPRLEGGNHSNELRALVAFCLEELPSVRPTIEQVQKQSYIYNTQTSHPTAALTQLVRAYKMWEDHGGSRKSLFFLGGAQGPSEPAEEGAAKIEEWNFSTTAAFDQDVSRNSTPQEVFEEAYGATMMGLGDKTPRDTQQPKPSRRRPPPEALSRMPPAPLEKLFDTNTISSYSENAYNLWGPQPEPPASDLPLRDDTAPISIRDTMIDLGGHDTETGMSVFPDMTIKPADRRPIVRVEMEEPLTSATDFSRPPLSDPADANPNRRTQDWKFPSMAPASADPEISRFPVSYEVPRPAITPASGARPALIHHPTEPVGGFGGMLGPGSSAVDRMSLIDLDMSLPDIIPAVTRPSTADSDLDSSSSAIGDYASGNPFDLERHASMYQPLPVEANEPLPYLRQEPENGFGPSTNYMSTIADISDFSASDAEQMATQNGHVESMRYDGESDSDYLSMPQRVNNPQAQTATVQRTVAVVEPLHTIYSMNRFPELPLPPSKAALTGTASKAQLRDEMTQQLAGMSNQLAAFRDVYGTMPSNGPNPRHRENGDNDNSS